MYNGPTETKESKMLTTKQVEHLRKTFDPITNVRSLKQLQRVYAALDRLNREELSTIAAADINVLSKHAGALLQKRIADGYYTGRNIA